MHYFNKRERAWVHFRIGTRHRHEWVYKWIYCLESKTVDVETGIVAWFLKSRQFVLGVSLGGLNLQMSVG